MVQYGQMSSVLVISSSQSEVEQIKDVEVSFDSCTRLFWLLL